MPRQTFFISHNKHRGGFTLVELSVALVIIGLVIGAIMLGQNLLRASQTQGVMRDVQKYTVAADLFFQKYKEVPGDFTGAEALWGSDAACPATPSNTILKKATCNGNGDGNISLTSAAPYRERFRAWQHLANAGMIDGAYSGVTGPTNGEDYRLGVNTPNGSLKRSGYIVFSAFGFQTDWPLAYYPAMNSGNYFGFYHFPADGSTWGPVLSPQEAYDIDLKMDDGRPGTGTVVSGRQPIAANCVTDDDPAVGEYNIAWGDTHSCYLFFNTGH